MTPTKPSYKSGEFWVSVAVAVLGGLLSAHVFGDGSTAQRLVGAVLAALGSINITASRTVLKYDAKEADPPK